MFNIAQNVYTLPMTYCVLINNQIMSMLPNIKPSSTSFNMLLQLATLFGDKLLAGVVIRATKLCNLQSNNFARQVARKCWPYYLALFISLTRFISFISLLAIYFRSSTVKVCVNEFRFRHDSRLLNHFSSTRVQFWHPYQMCTFTSHCIPLSLS